MRIKTVLEKSPHSLPDNSRVNKTVYESNQDFLISIVVPVFDASQWIERCFMSIAKQTYRNSNIECFFIDDCSQDDSAQILQNLIDKYDGEIKFVLIRQEKNCGAGECRNVGIRNSSGEYICFVDADDEILQNSLLILSGLAQKYKNVDIVQGQAEAMSLVDGKLVKQNYYDAFFEVLKFPEYTNKTVWIRKRMPFFNQNGYIPMTPWNKLIRRQFIVENNLYFSNIRSGQDLLWHFFASKHIKDIAFTANFTYLVHREHTSVIAEKQRTPFNRILVVEEMLKNINMENIVDTLRAVDRELNIWIIPYMDESSQYDELRKRIQKIKDTTKQGVSELLEFSQ